MLRDREWKALLPLMLLLYNSELQGELRNDKGKVFSPSVAPSALYDLGLPRDMPVVNDGTRILGVPVGSKEFQKSFISAHLDTLEDAFHILSSSTVHGCPAFSGSSVYSSFPDPI